MFLICLVSLLIIIHLLVHYSPKGRQFNKIQGPPIKFLAGNAFNFVCSQAQFFSVGRNFAARYKDTYRVWVFHEKLLIIMDPDDCEVLLTSSKHIAKNKVYKFLHPWLNEGLLTSTGSKWQTRRKILTPAFHFNILRNFCTIFNETAEEMILKITNVNEHIDIVPLISTFALQTICETAMGTKLDTTAGSVSETYMNNVKSMSEMMVYRTCRFWLHSDKIFSMLEKGRVQKKIVTMLHKFTNDVIEKRRSLGTHLDNFDENHFQRHNGKPTRLAMLDLLLSAEAKGLIDHKGIREEVDTFMFEGHDTTAMAICYCLMEIANNADIQLRITEELNEIYADPSESMTMETLNSMSYLEMCIKEGLRLCPSVSFFGRELVEDLQFKRFSIPAGTTCYLSVLDMHRREDLYPNPFKFDPERFTKENCTERHPFAYLPFSAGPRNCIGQKFAMLEMKAVISTVLRRFIIEPVTHPNEVIYTADIVLKSKNPIFVKFIRRERII